MSLYIAADKSLRGRVLYQDRNKCGNHHTARANKSRQFQEEQKKRRTTHHGKEAQKQCSYYYTLMLLLSCCNDFWTLATSRVFGVLSGGGANLPDSSDRLVQLGQVKFLRTIGSGFLDIIVTRDITLLSQC